MNRNEIFMVIERPDYSGEMWQESHKMKFIKCIVKVHTSPPDYLGEMQEIVARL
jgi:hypothetical protein